MPLRAEESEEKGEEDEESLKPQVPGEGRLRGYKRGEEEEKTSLVDEGCIEER